VQQLPKRYLSIRFCSRKPTNTVPSFPDGTATSFCASSSVARSRRNSKQAITIEVYLRCVHGVSLSARLVLRSDHDRRHTHDDR
jgi:hypothetical protein